jgi:hypothetical protein
MLGLLRRIKYTVGNKRVLKVAVDNIYVFLSHLYWIFVTSEQVLGQLVERNQGFVADDPLFKILLACLLS